MMKRKRKSPAKVKVQNQPRMPGLRRQQLSGAFEQAVQAAIEAEAQYYNVSRSYVLKVCAAIALEVKLDAGQSYKTAAVLRIVRGRKRA
jgi:hypothetical protein